jgi:hypothetical protein
VSAFGTPFERRPPSAASVLMVDATLGLDSATASPNLAPGASPSLENVVFREGAIEPRSMLSALGGAPNPLAAPMRGGLDILDTRGAHFPMVSSTSRLAFWANGAWAAASYAPLGALNDPPSGSPSNYWDWTQIYADWADETVAVGAVTSRQSLYAWRPGEATFSTLTGAPGARTVAAVDNYLLAANLRDTDGGLYVQRVRWSDRGSVSSWTGGLSGFEDLLAAKGAINRLAAVEGGVLAIFDDEVWRGVRGEYPFTFRFELLDSTVGSPYPWTVTQTPAGVLFLGRDYRVYLMPKAGGQAQPVGARLHRTIRDAIITPAEAWAVHDPHLNAYQLHYSASTAGVTRAAWLHLDSGAWAPQRFGVGLARGFGAEVQTSSGTTWGGLTASGLTWGGLSALGITWADLGNAGATARRVLLGSSAGTMYSLDSTVTSDAGAAVTSFWESGALGGEVPAAQKRLTEVRLDYTSAPAASTVTVRTSPSQGAAFDTGVAVSFASTSATSQAIAYVAQASRYPVVRIESEGARWRLQRLQAVMRVGGR